MNINYQKIKVEIEFGFSSKGSDIDNGLKVFLDVLQEKYNFNDNQIYKLGASKRIVSKGKEYIMFGIAEFKE